MDRYTKCVLTVIAVALVAQAAGSIARTPAVVAQSRDCGDRANPCMVKVVEERTPSVTVNDPHDCGNEARPCMVRIIGGPAGSWKGLGVRVER